MRDNFDKETKDILARRVGHRCSNPQCRKLTSGPRTDPTKAVNIGVAAHISAAAAGGPRYAPNLSPQERGSVTNGIWLCQNCGKLVDNDEQRYTTALLQTWKQQAELAALSEIEGSVSLSRVDTFLGLLAPFDEGHSSEEATSVAPLQQRPETLKYLILGIEDESWMPWMRLFADSTTAETSAETAEEVYFDDLNEMEEVFKSLHRSIDKALEAQQQGSNPQQAFERALKEEGIYRVSQIMFGRRETSTPAPKGIKYAVWGIHPNYANVFRILRPQSLVTEQPIPVRDAPEVVFKNAMIVAHIPEVIKKAVADAHNDEQEFKRCLLEATLRLRLLELDNDQTY